MTEPVLLKIASVPVADIDTRSRLRPVSVAGVASIVASIHELGVMKDAVHVRRRKDGRMVLIAGAHRLAAAVELGWAEIEAKVWAGVTDDWARLMEIDDNLAGAELDALDTAVFLAARKAVYERLHPETKRGVAGAKGRWDATELSSVAFVTATAAKFGKTERQIRKIVAAGTMLSPKDVQLLRAATRPVTLNDLMAIAKIGEAPVRYEAVAAFSEGRSRSIREAVKARTAGIVPAPKNKVDEDFKRLSTAWERAPMAAKKRFLLEYAREVWAAQNKGAALAVVKGGAA